MLNIKSKTGQAVCMLMNNWNCSIVVPNDFCESGNKKRNSGKLSDFAERIIRTNTNVKRIMINQGPYCDTADRICMKLDGTETHEVFLPKWTVIDFIVRQPDVSGYCNITFIQTGADGIQRLYVDGKEAARTEKDVNFFNKIKNVFSRFGLSEFWGKCTGQIKPCWGLVYKDKLYFGDENFHLNFTGDSLPEYTDQKDIGRVETYLSNSGLKKDDFIKPGLTQNDIVETLAKIAEMKK